MVGAAVALAAGIVLVLLVSGAFGSSRAQVNADGERVASSYGHPPAWETIPEPTRVQNPAATPAKPDTRAMEGYPVNARLSGGASVTLNAEGPDVPSWALNESASGAWKPGEPAPSSFDVTFSAARGPVPLSAGQFTVITYQGAILHPKVTVASGGALPSRVPAGRSVVVKLETSVPEGDGEVRWSPDGSHILVAYFWTLELS